MPFTLEKTQEIEAHLANNPYLSEGGLPGAEDGRIFFQLNKVAPDVIKTPNFHHWYYFVNSFNNDLIKTWVEGKKVEQKKPEKGDKKKQEKKHEKKEQKKEQKKDQKKAQKKADDDLFGDDDQQEPKKQAPPAPKPQVKKKKDKPAAKSIVVFEVKVYEQQTDLDALAKRILQIKIDGLVWNNEPKKVDIAYGMQKLQMGCVIEDDKVLTDDIFEPIQNWEQVQSVDMTSMQKL